MRNRLRAIQVSQSVLTGAICLPSAGDRLYAHKEQETILAQDCPAAPRSGSRQVRCTYQPEFTSVQAKLQVRDGAIWLNCQSEPPLPADHRNFVHQQNDYGR